MRTALQKKRDACHRRLDYQPLFREVIPRSDPREQQISSLPAPMLNVVLFFNSGQ